MDGFAGDAQLIGLNAAEFDAVKHRSLPVVADAREGLASSDERSADGRADGTGRARREATGDYHAYIDKRRSAAVGESGRPTYAQVIGAVNAEPARRLRCLVGRRLPR